jgi:site-specific DNA-cytosine methylase
MVPNPKHYQGDVRDILYSQHWDLMIAHPPCTHLALSGAQHFSKRPEEQVKALSFVQLLLDAPIAKIALENPVGVISSKIRKPDQFIQPYEYGHSEVKRTCLWLKGLPLLVPTKVIPLPANGRWDNRTPAGNCNIAGCKNKRMLRSITYQGIADAMAQQWG